jgi:hypothetical protein
LLVAALGALRKTEDMEALVLSFSQLPEGLAIRSLNQIIQSGNEAAADCRTRPLRVHGRRGIHNARSGAGSGWPEGFGE